MFVQNKKYSDSEKKNNSSPDSNHYLSLLLFTQSIAIHFSLYWIYEDSVVQG